MAINSGQKIRQKSLWLAPVVLLGLITFTVLLAPEEKTLGAGIKMVYIHVSLIWVGMTGLLLAGGLALLTLFPAGRKWYRWVEVISWVGLGFYTAGLLMSMLAAKVNWGAVFLQEPRMAAGLSFIAVAIVVFVLRSWFPWLWLKALLTTLVALALLWATYAPALLLHPDNPIQTSPSTGIQFTFIVLYGLMLLLGAWLVYWIMFKMPFYSPT